MGWAALAMTVLAAALILVTVWTGDGRWAATGAVVVVLAIVVAMTGLCQHEKDESVPMVEVPLPWARKVSD